MLEQPAPPKRWLFALPVFFALYLAGVLATALGATVLGLAIVLPTIVAHLVWRATVGRRLLGQRGGRR